MPICHRILLGKLTQHINTSAQKNKAVIGDAVSTMTSSGNDTSSWTGSTSSMAAQMNEIVNGTMVNSSSSPWLLFNQSLVNVTTSAIVGADGSGGPVTKVPPHAVNQNSVFIKIVLLLILTAVVLLSTYKFVVRLFSGYSEKKDDSSEYYIGIQDDS